jgi:hypothetical protein
MLHRKKEPRLPKVSKGPSSSQNNPPTLMAENSPTPHSMPSDLHKCPGRTKTY